MRRRRGSPCRPRTAPVAACSACLAAGLATAGRCRRAARVARDPGPPRARGQTAAPGRIRRDTAAVRQDHGFGQHQIAGRERGREAARKAEAHQPRGAAGEQPRRLRPRALRPRAAAGDRDVEPAQTARLRAQAGDHADTRAAGLPASGRQQSALLASPPPAHPTRDIRHASARVRQRFRPRLRPPRPQHRRAREHARSAPGRQGGRAPPAARSTSC